MEATPITGGEGGDGDEEFVVFVRAAEMEENISCGSHNREDEVLTLTSSSSKAMLTTSGGVDIEFVVMVVCAEMEKRKTKCGSHINEEENVREFGF